jgi:hypothetical protein
MTIIRSAMILGLASLALAISTGCSDDAGGTGGGGGGGVLPDPAVDACEHMAGGPFADVTATADASGAPDASTEHTAHNITLPGDETTGYVGYVSYVVDEATELVFYTDADVTLSLQDAGGSDLTWEDECTSSCTDACTLVQNTWTVDIETVGSYALRIESSTEDVTLVVVHAGDHEHE